MNLRIRNRLTNQCRKKKQQQQEPYIFSELIIIKCSVVIHGENIQYIFFILFWTLAQSKVKVSKKWFYTSKDRLTIEFFAINEWFIFNWNIQRRKNRKNIMTTNAMFSIGKKTNLFTKGTETCKIKKRNISRVSNAK